MRHTPISPRPILPPEPRPVFALIVSHPTASAALPVCSLMLVGVGLMPDSRAGIIPPLGVPRRPRDSRRPRCLRPLRDPRGCRGPHVFLHHQGVQMSVRTWSFLFGGSVPAASAVALVAGQQPPAGAPAPGPFTAAQADAGRTNYMQN